MVGKELIEGDVGKEVIPSCGCVFCDLCLEPVFTASGKYLHDTGNGNERVPCTNPAYAR